MKILLINPSSDSSYPILPLGLGYIAAVLEEAGHQVNIIDAWASKLRLEEVGQQIAGYQPRIVGITSMTPVYPQAKKVIQVAGANAPEACIILGGIHSSALPEQCLRESPALSLAVIGEGEETILELIRVLEGEYELSQVRGIAYRDGDVIRLNEPRPFIRELDHLPLPARHLFPWQKYKTHAPYGRFGSYANIMATRGCPFQCTYCSRATFGRSLRYRSVDNVIGEIKLLQADYDVKELHFYDDNLTFQKNWVRELCNKLLLLKTDLRWSCTTRVDLINPELLALMKKAGCWLIAYGVESGSQKILDNVKKGFTLEQVKEAFAWTHRVGIKTHAYFMIGLPGDTEDTAEATIRFALELNPYTTSWGGAIIFPGTDLEKTIKPENSSLVHFTFAEGLVRVCTGNLTAERIRVLVRRAYLKFYLRPGYILSIVRGLKTKHEFQQAVKALFYLLRESILPIIKRI